MTFLLDLVDDNQTLPMLIHGITDAIDSISDTKLQEDAFSIHLKRAALLSTSADLHDQQQLSYALEVLSKFLRGNLTLRETCAKFDIASELHLDASALVMLQSCLESYGDLKEQSLLFMYTHLVHLICNSISLQPKSVTKYLMNSDQLVKGFLKVLEHTATRSPLDVTHEQGITALLSFLYLSANYPPVHQLLKEDCLQSIGPLTQLPSLEIKVLSKALLARVIPVDSTNDDMAILTLIEDDEVDFLTSLIVADQSYGKIPLISVLMDLSRSPHNLFALVSNNVAVKLSDSMENFSKADQTNLAQLIWRMMELEYDENEEISAISNDGTLQLSKDWQVEVNESSEEVTEKVTKEAGHGFFSLFEAVTMEITTKLKNLSQAMELQLLAMEKFGADFTVKSAAILEIPEACSAIQRLTFTLCIAHYQMPRRKTALFDIRDVMLRCLVKWTCHSVTASAGLSRTLIILNLCRMLRDCIHLNMNGKIDLCIKIMINLASDSSNLPGFNTDYSQSYSILLLLPLTHGEVPSLALHSKMLLALLHPLLDCEQLHALKLTRTEANTCVALLRKAVEDPCHLVEDFTLLTMLKTLLCLTQEFHRQQDKGCGKMVCSEYEKKLMSVSEELKFNIEVLMEEDILSAIKAVLDLNGKEDFQAAAARLLWSLAHDNGVTTRIVNDIELVTILQGTENHPSSQNLKMATKCSCRLLGLKDDDGHQELLKYADACLEFKNYFECIEVCEKIILKAEKDVDDDDAIVIQAKILKGKAKFYSYKRKLQYVLVNARMRGTKEGRLILNESIRNMKESIALLSDGLDRKMLDKEGSKLLDWVMIDCLVTNNQLGECKRCLLCRQKRELKRSHVIPEFVNKLLQGYDSSKNLVFGLDKHQLKSPGQCHFYMLCGRCELLLCQNGENDFKAKFSSSGEIKYSSWLFSFCVGLIFRSIGSNSRFPMHFNDEEIYQVFLHCRKHLLQLPVNMNGKVSILSPQEKSQVEELTNQLQGDLDFYLFMSPLDSQRDFGDFQIVYPDPGSSMSRNIQLHSTNRNCFTGHVHFLSLFCGPITLIVEFHQSPSSLKNRGFHMSSNPTDSDLCYSIPSSEEDRVKLLPVGIWTLIEQVTESVVEDFNEVVRFTAPNAKLPTLQPVQNVPSAITKCNTKPKFQISFLPKEFEVGKPGVKLPRNQCVSLPNNNYMVVHSSRNVTIPSNYMRTVLLCTDEQKDKSKVSDVSLNKCKITSDICDCSSLYAIFVFVSDDLVYVDGARVEVTGNRLVLSEFLLLSSPTDVTRYSLSHLQNTFNTVLPHKHLENINLLLYLTKNRRFTKGSLNCTLPSLDHKCSPEGCWYCSDLCHHCMQPSITLYSGVLQDTHLKFCSEECKGFWFPPPDHKSLHVSSYLDKSSQSEDTRTPLMTIISRKDDGVEQIFLSVSGASESVENAGRPYIVWHIKGLEHQYFAHFYISQDCLPLNSVWVKQISTSENEATSNLIATKRMELQARLLQQFNEAAGVCGFKNFEAFLEQIKFLQHDESETLVPEDTDKPKIRSNLPSGFIFCDPELGFAHGSIRTPIDRVTTLLHCVEEDECFHSVHLLTVANLYNSSIPLELYLISMKHHLKEGWYFVDGAILSSDGTSATRFLVDDPAHERSPESLGEINGTVQRIVPEMLRRSGVPSIHPLLWLTRYTWIDQLAVKLDIPCSSSDNCWYCKGYCLCCSYFITRFESGSKFCSENCQELFTSATFSANFYGAADLAEMFQSNKIYSILQCLPLVAFMQKVLSTELDQNTVLRIYLCKSDDSFEVLPAGTSFAICQIKTASTQTIIDCVLSKDYIPLEPVWYSNYCEQMIEKHRALLSPEIMQLWLHCNTLSVSLLHTHCTK